MARVSRETAAAAGDADLKQALALVPEIAPFLEPLEAFVRLLDRWRKVTNLIGEASFATVWTRHVADSAQLLALAPNSSLPLAGTPQKSKAPRWLDLGAGAGFPGLIVAILLSETANAEVHCVEADKRKCAFLREAARATGARAIIHPAQIETLSANDIADVAVVSARALSPLPRLLQQAKPWLDAGAVGIFPRGASERDFTLDAALAASYDIASTANRVDPRGRVLMVKSLKDKV